MNVARVVALSAIYDLVITAPFASPWTATLSLQLLVRLHQRLSLSGAVPSVADPYTLLFANLMGSLVLVWAVVRLLSPTAGLGMADTAGRALFSAWMGWAVVHGASRLLLAFLVLEVFWGVVQGVATLPHVALRARTPP